MSAQTFDGPRFGRDALPERNGSAVTTEPCPCVTCGDMGAWLTEPHYRVTFSDGVSIAHAPARWIK